MKRIHGEEIRKRKLSGSKDIFLLCQDLCYLEHEQFVCFYMNRAGYLLKRETISVGGIAGTVVDPKIIFHHAIILKASTIVLAHNHPSSNLQPSNADIEITKKIKNGGAALDIFVADHLIVAGDNFSNYYSFADEGII